MRKVLLVFAGSLALVCLSLSAFVFVKYRALGAFPVRVANLKSYSIWVHLFPDIKTWLGYWYPGLIPLTLSVPALLVMAFMLMRQRKKPVPAN